MSKYKKFFLLDGLSASEKSAIESSFPETTFFAKGALIYSSVSFSKSIGYIVNGSAYAVADNNNKILMRKFSAGMSFGAAAVFGSNQSYVSTIIAETDIEILFITEEVLKALFKEYPRTAINYVTFLSDKIRFLNSKLSVISCSSAEDTVYKYLVASANEQGYVRLPGSMTMLSKMLGLGRASLYRSIEALENEQKIIREKNTIKVIENEKTL